MDIDQEIEKRKTKIKEEKDVIIFKNQQEIKEFEKSRILP